MTTQSKAQGAGEHVETGNGLAKTGDEFLFSIAHVQGAMAQAMLRCNLELLDFYKNRIESDLSAVQKMSCCTTIDELNEIGALVAQQAVDDYAREFNRLTNMSAELTSETAAIVNKETKQALSSVA